MYPCFFNTSSLSLVSPHPLPIRELPPFGAEVNVDLLSDQLVPNWWLLNRNLNPKLVHCNPWRKPLVPPLPQRSTQLLGAATSKQRTFGIEQSLWYLNFATNVSIISTHDRWKMKIETGKLKLSKSQISLLNTVDSQHSRRVANLQAAWP